MFRCIYFIGLFLLLTQTVLADTTHKHVVKHKTPMVKHKHVAHHPKHKAKSHHHAHQAIAKKAAPVVVDEDGDDEDDVSVTRGMPTAEVEKTSTQVATASETPAVVQAEAPKPPSLFQKTVAVLEIGSQERMVTAFGKRVAEYVRKTVKTLHYSDYKLGGTRFDTNRGVYVLDCSSYVDHILQQVSPNAYENLMNVTGTDKPTTQHYSDFFRDLNYTHNDYWDKVDNVEHLRAGDILVFRYKNSRGIETGGHVMVVMDKPMRDTDVYFVRVADSAPSRHSEDTLKANEAGIGIGTLLLKVNPANGHPSAFSWGIGGYWKRNVNFAMARPVDLGKSTHT